MKTEITNLNYKITLPKAFVWLVIVTWLIIAGIIYAAYF